MVTDAISDMLTRLRNAAIIGKPQVMVEGSKLKLALAEILKREGYLATIAKKTRFNKVYLILDIKYNEAGRAKFSTLERVSKPSRRLYRKAEEIYPVKQGYGFWVVSTSTGLMTDKEARKAKIGGEVICKIW